METQSDWMFLLGTPHIDFGLVKYKFKPDICLFWQAPITHPLKTIILTQLGKICRTQGVPLVDVVDITKQLTTLNRPELDHPTNEWIQLHVHDYANDRSHYIQIRITAKTVMKPDDQPGGYVI